ncbi:MAG: translation initiation factor IF-2, partial [bacterium]|nr:translation initiation factor IF-2 [bacterium]
LVAEQIGKAVQFVSQEIEELLEPVSKVDESRFVVRAPIVTVMGHVDHGKTSILDYIRKSRVAASEAGGITQHVGAYHVNLPKGQITFIDTPGHEAFTSMRARGAQATDIVILVIASDDGIMPQTVEAIDHAKAANVPIIVALNKSDLPAARPDQIKQQLTERGVVVEEFGGDTVSVEVSAKTGDGIDRLLEMILLQAELLELKADPHASARGVAVEVKKEEGRGILCTVLVTQGTLGIGDVFVIGSHYGKVRALLDDRGGSVKEVGPGYPVQVLGANGLPNAGDKLMVVKGEREARDVSERRQQLQKERDLGSARKMTLEELFSQIQQGDVKELRLVVKADTNGSVEALTQSLTKLTNDEVGVKVIHAGVGVASESDILLASSSDAVVIAFSVKTSPKAQEMAEREKVEIKSYKIIYEVLEEVDAAMKGLLDPILSEKVLGRAEIRKVFKVPRLGFIAGSFVTEGLIQRNASARVLRENEVVHEGKISSLKRFQDDVREVQTDFECGIGITGFSDPREGDIIEAFVIEEKARVG